MTKVTIIIPCFNEESTIKEIIIKITKLNNLKKQIIVVDDFSTDNSLKIIKDVAKDNDIEIIEHKENLGKGSSIISAKKRIKGDIVIIQDADLEYEPNDYYKLIEPIINKESLVVYGSRVLGKNYFENLQNFSHWFRILGNLFLTKLSNILNNQKLTDAHTCYKVFEAKLFQEINLNEKNFNFCPEITTKISNRGITILELPISYRGRDYNEGKKIKLIDAFKAVYCIFKYKFSK